MKAIRIDSQFKRISRVPGTEARKGVIANDFWKLIKMIVLFVYSGFNRPSLAKAMKWATSISLGQTNEQAWDE